MSGGPDDARDPFPGEAADDRSDIEQVVGARADAVAAGEGGEEPGPITSSGEFSGVSGDGGEVKNQDLTAR